jgi:hypothetical protein
MSATVRTCAYDGAVYAMGDSCPTCGAQHSTADVALERVRAQQLDTGGQLHDLAPAHERLRLVHAGAGAARRTDVPSHR